MLIVLLPPKVSLKIVSAYDDNGAAAIAITAAQLRKEFLIGVGFRVLNLF